MPMFANSSSSWLFPILIFMMITLMIFMMRRNMHGHMPTMHENERQHSIPPPVPQRSPQEIIKERYALGEIDFETYQTMLSHIGIEEGERR